MKNYRGFTLIEVMVAGALMLGIVAAVYQVLTNTSRSASEIEKRLRYRDLVEDMRFVFSHGPLCKESFRAPNFGEGAAVEVELKKGSLVREGVTLPDYGLVIQSLRLRGVRQFPRSSHRLMNTYGVEVGQYTEESATADLEIQAKIAGSGKSLKPMTVVRVIVLKREGVVNEDICRGNYLAPTLNPSSAVADKAYQENRLNSPAVPSSASSFQLRDVDEAISGLNRSARVIAALKSQPTPSSLVDNRSVEDCLLSSSLQAQAKRKKLINGELLKVAFEGRAVEIFCEQGQIREINR